MHTRQHTAPQVSKLGPPTRLTALIRAGLAVYLEARPWAYPDEIEYYLFDDWGIVVNKFTISRANHISHRVLKCKAEERLQLCRDLYHLKIGKHMANEFIHFDKSTQIRFHELSFIVT